MLTFRPEVISRLTGLHSVCSGLSDLAPSMACTLRRMHALSNLAPMHAIVHVNLSFSSPPQLSTSLIIFFCQKKNLSTSLLPLTHTGLQRLSQQPDLRAVPQVQAIWWTNNKFAGPSWSYVHN